MAETVDPAVTILATLRNSPKHMTYAAFVQVEPSTSVYTVAPRPRQAVKESGGGQKAIPTLPEENALVDYILRAATRGYPVPVKLLPHLAWMLIRPSL